MRISRHTLAHLQPHRLKLRAVVQRLVLLGRERVVRLARELTPPCRLVVRLGLVFEWLGAWGQVGAGVGWYRGRVWVGRGFGRELGFEVRGKRGEWGWGWGGLGGNPRLAFSASTFHVSAAAPASAKSPEPAFSAERFHMVASSAWMVKTPGH